MTSSRICWSPKDFTSLEEVAFVAIEELASVEGFDENVAGELQQRARFSCRSRTSAMRRGARSLASATMSRRIQGMTRRRGGGGREGVKTLDDLADLAADELIEMAGAGAKLEEDEATRSMAARLASQDRPKPGGGLGHPPSWRKAMRC